MLQIGRRRSRYLLRFQASVIFQAGLTFKFMLKTPLTSRFGLGAFTRNVLNTW